MNSAGILEMIKMGTKDSPIASKQIEIRLGITGTVVRDAVRELRRSGHPICAISSKKDRSGGYFYSHDKLNIQEMRDDLIGRISSMSHTLRDFDKNYEIKCKIQGEFGFTDAKRVPEHWL